jgi:hypothetical protein
MYAKFMSSSDANWLGGHVNSAGTTSSRPSHRIQRIRCVESLQWSGFNESGSYTSVRYNLSFTDEAEGN